MKVIAHVQETVKRMFGVTLELEVKLVNGREGQSEKCGG